MVANVKSVTKILRSKKLNITEIRRQLISILLEPGTALTQKEIENLLGEVDRVTLYRTLKVLLSKKIIHKIPIDAQTVKYKLADEHLKSDHPHFHCSRCDRLLCMPEVKIPGKLLPEGFIMHSSQLVIAGICAPCNRLNKRVK